MPVLDSDTIVARATPAGMGAVAVVRISGPQALVMTDQLLRKPISHAPSHTLHLKRLYDGDQLLDEALVALFQGSKSYTGEPTVELSLHGSEFIVQRVLQAYLKRGARMAEPGEFTQRAFLNGKLDLAQAEAVSDLIASEHEAAHSQALHQLRGGFSQDIAELRAKLLHFVSLMELELDFGEEDVEFASRSELKSLVEELRTRLAALEESYQLGNALKKGFALVLAGRPNAGKSTLFNGLIREDKALVSDIEGTTRDAIEDQFFVDGFRIRLIDTAGIRAATDTIEQMGIERTWNHVAQSGATLFLVDASHWSPADFESDLAALQSKNAQIWVLATKMDLVQQPPAELEELLKRHGLPGLLSVAAQDAVSLLQLRKDLAQRFAAELQPFADQTVVTNARHAEALARCRAELDDLLAGMEAGLSGDLLVFHLRHGIAQLGRITGEIDADEVLGSIFSSFCIGK